MAGRKKATDEGSEMAPANGGDGSPRVYAFTLTGITPLLMHADDVEQADRLDEWRKAPENKGVSKAGDDRSPPWTWKTYCYQDGQYLAIPSDNLMAALRYAGSQLILKKQKTFKSATQCGLVIRELFCPILLPVYKDPTDPESEITDWKPVKAADVDAIEGPFSQHAKTAQELGFKLFVKRAPVGASKHVRVRPRFEKWMVKGTVEVAMQEFTEEVLTKLWAIAGNYAGLCDWRPASPKSPGPFGRFTVELRELKGEAA